MALPNLKKYCTPTREKPKPNKEQRQVSKSHFILEDTKSCWKPRLVCDWWGRAWPARQVANPGYALKEHGHWSTPEHIRAWDSKILGGGVAGKRVREGGTGEEVTQNQARGAQNSACGLIIQPRQSLSFGGNRLVQ